MGWLEASQPDGASGGHPIEIASANLACRYSAFKRRRPQQARATCSEDAVMTAMPAAGHMR